MDNFQTDYEIVAKINGNVSYVDFESLIELPDDTLVAKVKVVRNNGKEVSRDEFVSDDSWMTVKDYFKSD